jgi:hypothetical protein
MLQVAVRKDFFVLDVIEIPSLTFTFDGNIEHFFDGYPMTVEGYAVHGHTSTHIRLHPSFIQILETDASRTIDGADNPYVLLEDSGWFHTIRVVKYGAN